jgi:hypothetical protein
MRNILFLSTIFVMISVNVMGQDEKLVARYIYNIVQYVNWPDAYKSGDFVIGVFGSGDITKELKKIAATKKVVSQTISVVEFNSVDEISKCHVLFITDAKSGLIKEALMKLGTNATLIIGETDGLAMAGAGINFVNKEGELVFQLNENAIKRRGLQTNSKLRELSM